MLVKLHDRLLPESVADYDAAHREVPSQVVEGIRRAGIVDWTIWREGTDLFQLIECADWVSASRSLEAHTPSAWAARMRELVDPTFEPPAPEIVVGSWRLRVGVSENFK